MQLFDKNEDERKALLREVELWTTKGIQDKKFHGGNTPDLVDLDIYGVLQVFLCFLILIFIAML